MEENNIKKDKEAVECKIIPYHDVKSMTDFLDQPKVKIAEAVTGALSLGKSEAIQMGGRIVQGVIKGNFLKQIGREIRLLIDKGKIREDYAETENGFQSLSELLEFIDKEVPDKVKFNAVKTIFYSVISKNISKHEEILNYQLFKLVRKLNSKLI